MQLIKSLEVLVLNRYISEFLEEVCSQIKYKKIHEDISLEIQGHIYELMDEYMENGMNEDRAVEKAIQQLGNPIEIGKELHKTHKPKTEWSIILLIGFLILISGVVLFSTIKDDNSIVSMNHFYKSYLVYAVIGIIICSSGYFLDVSLIERYSLHIFIATLAVLLICMKLSFKLNGIPSIHFGLFIIRPVTMVLPLLLISFCGLLTKWATGSVKDMIKLVALATMAVVLCIIQPSSAIAFLLFCGFTIMITIAIVNKTFIGNRKPFLLTIYGSITMGIFLLLIRVLSVDYMRHRLLAFFNPKSDPLGAGFLIIQYKKMLSGAKFIGKSDNYSLVHKWSGNALFPGLTDNYVFTYIVTAFGWIAGACLILIIALIITRMFIVTRNIRYTYGKYVAISIVAIFSLQVILNIFMNIGLFPSLDISFPLISYGGINFIINMALFGLLLGIYRRKDIRVHEMVGTA